MPRQLLAILALAVVFATQSVYGIDCSKIPERVILDATLDHDFVRAEKTLESINTDNALIPSVDFYRGLLNWIRATLSDDRTRRSISVDDLQKAVDELKRSYGSKPEPDRYIAWHLAAAHTARILLAEEQLLKGYRMGLESVQVLMGIVYDRNYRAEQRAAAALATGLYYVYLNYIPDEFAWVKPVVKVEGSIDEGRKLIEFSVRNSPQYSSEAARSLLMEVPWATPMQCDLLELAKQLAAAYPNNIDLSIVLQGIYLRCGHPGKSLDENLRIRAVADRTGYAGLTEESYREILDLGRIRALAQSGAVAEIKMLIEQQPQQPLYEYALANALDVANQRETAMQYYNRLADSSHTPQYLRNNAVQRLTIPYTVPETINRRNGLKLLTCQS